MCTNINMYYATVNIIYINIDMYIYKYQHVYTHILTCMCCTNINMYYVNITCIYTNINKYKYI